MLGQIRLVQGRPLAAGFHHIPDGIGDAAVGDGLAITAQRMGLGQVLGNQGFEQIPDFLGTSIIAVHGPAPCSSA
jgi:hypothetical protein